MNLRVGGVPGAPRQILSLQEPEAWNTSPPFFQYTQRYDGT